MAEQQMPDGMLQQQVAAHLQLVLPYLVHQMLQALLHSFAGLPAPMVPDVVRQMGTGQLQSTLEGLLQQMLPNLVQQMLPVAMRGTFLTVQQRYQMCSSLMAAG